MKNQYISNNIDPILRSSCIEITNNKLELYPSIFYLGLGKTGSQSVCNGFVKNKVAHWHSEKFFDVQYKTEIIKNNIILTDIVEYTYTKTGTSPLIVEGFREPISRALSALFQELHMKRLHYDAINVRKWLQNFLLNPEPPYIYKIQKIYDIDIQSNFDQKNGYCWIEKNNIKFLYYKFETINNIKELLNSKNYTYNTIRKNVTSDREKFTELYQKEKNNLKFDYNFVKSIYNNDWVKMIYSAEEISYFIEKYSI